MIAAFATLLFLSTLWMLVVVGAAVLETSGAKMLAASRARAPSPALAIPPVRVRHQRFQPQRTARISVRQRAAA